MCCIFFFLKHKISKEKETTKKGIMNNETQKLCEDFAIHLVDKVHFQNGSSSSSSSTLISSTETQTQVKCHLLLLAKSLLKRGSVVFKSAFEAKQLDEFTDNSSETILPHCEHETQLYKIPFVEFQSTIHRSFQTLIDFFESFEPFVDWKKKILISNVHEWLELSEEYCIPIIRDHCATVILDWTTRVNINSNNDIKEQSFILVTLIAALEKFRLDILLDTILKCACIQRKWEFFPLSPHFHCCLSKTSLIKLLHLNTEVEREMTSAQIVEKKSNTIFECKDSDGLLCLAKILEIKDEKQNNFFKAKINFIGWSAKWDTWVDSTQLKEPQKSKPIYRIGWKNNGTFEEIMKKYPQ